MNTSSAYEYSYNLEGKTSPWKGPDISDTNDLCYLNMPFWWVFTISIGGEHFRIFHTKFVDVPSDTYIEGWGDEERTKEVYIVNKTPQE